MTKAAPTPVQIGRFNELMVLRTVRIGMYLDGGLLGDILLPNNEAPMGPLTGQKIRVFIYRDSEDRLVATSRVPLCQVGETAVLRVKAIHPQGAFLDWGLAKDLLVPHREQKVPMEAGSQYLVHVYLDALSQRVVASTRLQRFLNKSKPPFAVGDEVDLWIGHGDERGFVALISEGFYGMIYRNEVFRRVDVGERCKGYIKQLRPDGKIDLALQPPGADLASPLSEQILTELRKAPNGLLFLSDKTPPVIIQKRFGVSKNVFKKAIATLYRERRIRIEPLGIRLVREDEVDT